MINYHLIVWVSFDFCALYKAIIWRDAGEWSSYNWRRMQTTEAQKLINV